LFFWSATVRQMVDDLNRHEQGRRVVCGLIECLAVLARFFGKAGTGSEKQQADELGSQDKRMLEFHKASFHSLPE